MMGYEPCRKSWGNDFECFDGVIMDADKYHEGFELDVIYQPCPCHPKYCHHCKGSGKAAYDVFEDHVNVHTDCDKCNGTGWLGEPELPIHEEKEHPNDQ